jgi:hypothetical protein
MPKVAQERYVKIFSFGELWHSNDGKGWPCEITPRCRGKSHTKVLTQAEVDRVKRDVPQSVYQGDIYGPDAAAFILTRRIGSVACIRHLHNLRKRGSISEGPG